MSAPSGLSLSANAIVNGIVDMARDGLIFVANRRPLPNAIALFIMDAPFTKDHHTHLIYIQHYVAIT